MKFNTEIRGAFEVEKWIKKHFPKEVERAMKGSLNKTNNKIRSKATKRISAASNIRPQKLIRQRIGRIRPKRNKMRAGTVFVHASMNAELIGNPKWNRNMTGARVKSFRFPGSFTGTPGAGKNAGKKRIYRRVGNTGSNYRDLRPERISLDPYKKYHIGAGRQVSRYMLKKEFTRQLKWRMGL